MYFPKPSFQKEALVLKKEPVLPPTLIQFDRNSNYHALLIRNIIICLNEKSVMLPKCIWLNLTVLFAKDVVGTGRTMQALLSSIEKYKPNMVKVAR